MKIMHIMAGRGQGGAETYSTDVMLSLHALCRDADIDQCVVMAADAPRFAELSRAGPAHGAERYGSTFQLVATYPAKKTDCS